MAYLADERDVEFNLFEYLQIQKLKDFEAFSQFTEEELRHLLSEVLKFSQKELAPLNLKSDRVGCRFENGKVITPPGFSEMYRSYAAQGYIGVDVPTTYGGLGLPVSIAVPMAEYLFGACFSFMMFPGLTRGAAHLIESFGSPKLAALYCPKMYSGEWAGTMCLTEPQAGSAVGDLRTIAKKGGDGYSIRGQKIFISCGDNDFSPNVIHLVLARIEGDPEGTKGISLFVVPKIRVGNDGSLAEANDVKTVGIEEKLGIHGSPTCTLAFGDHQECVGYLVGEPCKGMSYMFQLMNEARVMTGMQGLSTASNAYLHSLSYAKERVQGGKTTIVNYPDVRRMLATMKASVEGMRGLLYKVGLYIDQAEHETDPAKKENSQGLADLLTPVCKAFCSDKGFEVTTLAMQVYGGYGYIAEYPIEQMLRDVKISSIYEGTNGIQALDLLGRKMALKNGEVFRNFYDRLQAFADQNSKHPTLNEEFASFKKGLELVGQVAMKLFEIAMGGDRDYPALQAVPFLQMLGHLALAWVLLEQALIALPKLESLWEKAGADVEEKKTAFCDQNANARFYEGKVKSARFYLWNLFPALISTGKAILKEDRSALKIRFPLM
jgi:alkylation response protein AidB-like acyl-CoA dehydrogenase